MSVQIKHYAPPQVSEKAILHYAACRETTVEINSLLQECIAEVYEKISYKVCFCELDVKVCEDKCDFGFFLIESSGLAKNLSGCNRVLLFAATIGVEIDRLISKYCRISPAKALLLQAIGTERIEALCDTFCADMTYNGVRNLKPRFSPGYGDVPLTVQKHFFELLDCPRKIGVCLGENLLMTPSKSVTAFVGIKS